VPFERSHTILLAATLVAWTETLQPRTLKFGEGDLLLCKLCDEARFCQYLASRPASSSSTIIIICHVLSGRASVESIRKVLIACFYTAGEINTAGKLLVSVFYSLTVHWKQRHVHVSQSPERCVWSWSQRRYRHLWLYMDQSFLSALSSVIAANFDHVPKYHGPKELNICVIVDKQCETEARLVKYEKYTSICIAHRRKYL